MNARPVLSARLATLLLGGGLLGALVLGLTMGVRLGHQASHANAEELRVVDPASQRPLTAEGLRSPGGFAGFGGPPALQGDVLRHGTVTDFVPGRFVLADGASEVTIEYGESRRLYRIRAAAAAPIAGDSVVLTLDGDRVTGMLLVR